MVWNPRSGLRIDSAWTGSLDDVEERYQAKVTAAARLAVNSTARRARTLAARAIREKKAFPGGYVNDRLEITQYAKGDNLLAIITGRYRPTQLVRFGAKQLTRKGKTVPRRNAGVSVRVNRDSPRRKLRGAFFVMLRAGKTEGINQGIAIQVPGKNSKGNPKFKVLYSSSVHNVFADVIPDLNEPVQEMLQVEFRRQMGRG